MVVMEGDTSGVSPKQIEFILSVLEEKGFGDAKVTMKAVGEAGDNYVANVKRIVAEKDGKTFRMVAKVAPTIEQMRLAMNTHILFNNEYVMYSQVLPKFTAMEEAAGIPPSERLRYAKFYGALMEEPIEIILLEDLQVPGFVILDRFKPLSNEVIRLVLKNFAILHCHSYVLKSKEPEIYEEFKKVLVNPWVLMAKDENMKIYFKSNEEDALSVLTDERHKAAVKGISKMDDITLSLNESDVDSRFSVIQQGDSWTNNIMFKLEGDTVEECCMIDYQIARVGSPASDLHYMIFACTDYEGRAKHFHQWIDYYHSELADNLSKHGLKVEDCYPRELLYSDLKRYAKYGLGVATMLATILTRETAEAAVMKQAMEDMDPTKDVEELFQSFRISNVSEKTSSLFTIRVEDAVKTLLELGYV